MKKLLFAVVSALAVAGVQAADSTEFGVLCVPSSARETIVAVPWLASGTGSESVKVADLVLTSGLNTGDELKYYNGSGYQCWRLDANKVWIPSNTITESSDKDIVAKVTAEAGANDAQLDRGKAIFLVRGEPIAPQFYIMGKPTSDTATIDLGVGYSLIAPPSVSATDVNTGMTWSGIVTGDQLLIPNGGKFDTLSWKVKNNWSGWRKWDADNGVWIDSGITIPAGTGVWFLGGSSGKSVTFGSVAK